MLNIPSEVVALLKADSVHKNFRVIFPSGEHDDITNENLVAESVHFTESVMSQDKFKLGLCESPVIEFEAFGIENIKGKKIECYYEIYCASTVEDAVYREDLDAYVYPIPLGVFYVDSCQKEAKMNMRKVIAYGTQAYFDWKIPEGTFYKFYTSTDTIDISTYLALVTQSLATVDVTSIADIAEGNVKTRKDTNLYVYYKDSYTPPAQQYINFTHGSMYRLINPMSIFVDFVSTSPSEKSMTWEIDRIRVRMIRITNLLRSQTLSHTGDFFTFDTVSKVPNPNLAQNDIVEKFNQYIQTYECRVGTRPRDIVSHIDYIKDKGNTAFYTQHFAFASYGDAEDVLQDIKYVLTEDIGIPSYMYVWNNNKTEYERYSASDNYLTDVIANLERGSTTSQAYSQAIANLKSVWETVTGRTWGNDYVYDSGWANGEGNVITFGKKINRNRMSYSLGKNEYLTPQEAQSYTQSIIESYGKIGRVNREGNFEAFTIDTTTDVDTITPSEYQSAWYDDELSLPYGACSATHKVNDTDTYTIVYADGYDADSDPSTYQIYDISDNDLVKEMTVEQITPILTTIITNLSNLQYMPSDIDMVGRPDIEVGDRIEVQTSPGTFNTYVLSRTIDGIQGLSDTITAK